jgi:hypothetical protein
MRSLACARILIAVICATMFVGAGAAQASGSRSSRVYEMRFSGETRTAGAESLHSLPHRGSVPSRWSPVPDRVDPQPVPALSLRTGILPRAVADAEGAARARDRLGLSLGANAVKYKTWTVTVFDRSRTALAFARLAAHGAPLIVLRADNVVYIGSRSLPAAAHAMTQLSRE